jgi:hypothetical protein
MSNIVAVLMGLEQSRSSCGAGPRSLAIAIDCFTGIVEKLDQDHSELSMLSQILVPMAILAVTAGASCRAALTDVCRQCERAIWWSVKTRDIDYLPAVFRWPWAGDACRQENLSAERFAGQLSLASRMLSVVKLWCRCRRRFPTVIERRAAVAGPGASPRFTPLHLASPALPGGTEYLD